ncbi:MAG: AI-2E family transporter, partial [Candidatus Methanofastidiosia archaeon]
SKLLVFILTFTFILLPMILFLVILITEVVQELSKLLTYPQTQKFFELLGRNFQDYLESISNFQLTYPLREFTLSGVIEFSKNFSLENLGEFLSKLLEYQDWILKIFSYLLLLLKMLGSASFQIGLGIFLSLYILWYRERISLYLKTIRNEKVQRFLSHMNSGAKQVVYSMILTGIFTGLISVPIYLFFNLSFVAILATLTGILAMIPVLGGWLIYLPLTFYLLTTRGLGSSLLFLVLCVIFISTVPDILVRPIVVSLERKVSLVPVILGLICGVALYGALGILVGPLIFLGFFNFLKIFVFEDLEEERESKLSFE